MAREALIVTADMPTEDPTSMMASGVTVRKTHGPRASRLFARDLPMRTAPSPSEIRLPGALNT
jgi:hypothetical protein